MRILCILLALMSFQLAGSDDNFIGVRPRILDGFNVPVSTFPYVAKLMISKTDGQTFLDSGTLISPYHILTAGHTVTDTFGNLNITTDSRVYINGQAYTIALYEKHPLWFGNVLDYSQVDASIVTLSSPVLNVAPIPTFRYTPVVGSNMTIVGYGQQGTGLFGENGTLPINGTVNYGNTRLDYLLPARIEWTFVPGESSIGHGDSGGPEFLGTYGNYHVAGITSYNKSGNDKWYTVNGATRVDAIAPFIDSVVGFTDLSAGPVATQVQSTVRVGEIFTITSTVSNIGFNTSPSFTVRFRLSPDGVYRDSDPFLGDARVAYVPEAGGFAEASITAVMPNVALGAYRIAYYIDVFDEVYESDKSNNIYASSGLVTVKLDHPPQILSGPFVDPQPSFVGQELTFQVYATDADGDALKYHWDFGDGTSADGNPVFHPYATEGTYDITLTISDGIIPVVTDVGTLDVISEFPVQMFKNKFLLNFSSRGLIKDSFDATFSSHEALSFFNKNSFTSAMSDIPYFTISIGGSVLDVGQVYQNAKGYGLNGTLSWNYKKGEVRYSAKNLNLKSILGPLGAVNASVSIYPLQIPMMLTLRSAKYTTTANFHYVGKFGKTGTGR